MVCKVPYVSPVNCFKWWDLHLFKEYQKGSLDNGLESTVYLHGNHIATYFHDTRELQLFDGGWQSNTTKSRLNALLDEFDYGSFVFQKNWQWFFARNFNPSSKVDFISGMVVK